MEILNNLIIISDMYCDILTEVKLLPFRQCVPELKSAGWQSAILGQLVGTRKIQDGCRDHGKLQNVFIFTLHHARNIT